MILLNIVDVDPHWKATVSIFKWVLVHEIECHTLPNLTRLSDPLFHLVNWVYMCDRAILWLSRFHEYLHLLTFSPVGTDEEINIHSETLNAFKDKHYSMIRQAMGQLFVLCTTLQLTIMYTNHITANYKDR